MITLTLNGQPCTCDKVQTLTELLRARAIAPDTVAVALNGTFVPKDRHDTTPPARRRHNRDPRTGLGRVKGELRVKSEE